MNKEIIEILAKNDFLFNIGQFKEIKYNRSWNKDILRFCNISEQQPICITVDSIVKLNINKISRVCEIIIIKEDFINE